MPRIVPALALALMLTGCTHLSVGHLESNPVSLDQQEELSMRYWDFEYVSQVENDSYLVQGKAYPRQESFPGWGKWVHNLWVAAYLSDDEGRVLAKDLSIHSTLEMDPETGVPFEFRLQPEKMTGSRDLYVTFGYRMQVTEDRMLDPDQEPGWAGKKNVFYASEQALSR